MEKPGEHVEQLHDTTQQNVADIVGKLAVDYLQLVVEGARSYQNEMEKSEQMPFLLRNIKSIARANARFLDGVAARVQMASEIMAHAKSQTSAQEGIDYEKLAQMVADKLAAMQEAKKSNS